MRQKYIRCEMIPTSAGGEQQDYISGRIQLPSDIASGILEMEYSIPIIRLSHKTTPVQAHRGFRLLPLASS